MTTFQLLAGAAVLALYGHVMYLRGWVRGAKDTALFLASVDPEESDDDGHEQ